MRQAVSETRASGTGFFIEARHLSGLAMEYLLSIDYEFTGGKRKKASVYMVFP
ncbi:hypothetical protein ACO0LM_17130 [Undibacterium sp. Di26W]|uniref:hypothetical protein n=1 Tax=Undibacterium sp. Di26W TaxID=3413035 RepID=UPI003BF061D4